MRIYPATLCRHMTLYGKQAGVHVYTDLDARNWERRCLQVIRNDSAFLFLRHTLTMLATMLALGNTLACLETVVATVNPS